MNQKSTKATNGYSKLYRALTVSFEVKDCYQRLLEAQNKLFLCHTKKSCHTNRTEEGCRVKSPQMSEFLTL